MARKEIIKAHTHSSKHKEEVLTSDLCGCFYCIKIFKPDLIKEWVYGEDAICPFCNIDSIIGANSGYPITTEFLEEMCDKWFNTD